MERLIESVPYIINRGEIYMQKKELIKRYILFGFCLFFMGVGIALTKHGNLGVSPISSLANVLSCKFTSLSFGNWLIVTNCLLLLGQIVVLRKKFQRIQLLQIPLAFMFGYFTDLGMFMVAKIPNDIYIMQICLVFMGTVVLGFGIFLGVTAEVILNSGEGFVKAFSDTIDKEFSTTKIAFDITWTSISAILSLCLFDGKIVGIREGTLISAVCAGLVVKFFTRILGKPLKKFIAT